MSNPTETHPERLELRHRHPGFDQAVQDMEIGETKKVTIPSKDAYGERSLEKIERVPKNMFPSDAEIEEGMQFQAESADGHPIILTVTAIEAEEIIVDGNHPMAGMQLHFEVELVDIRDATEEEIEHGHIHGPGGHEH